MSDSFDPYYQWLGIPPREQPPHHYRLLGVAAFEENADVIANAADQRMGHVRSFQTGEHAALSQRLLNELATARVCLLNPAKKAAYDAALQQQLAAGQQPQSQGDNAADVFANLGIESITTSSARPRRRRQPAWQVLAGIAVVVVIVIAIATFLLSGGRDEKPNVARSMDGNPSERSDKAPGESRPTPVIQSERDSAPKSEREPHSDSPTPEPPKAEPKAEVAQGAREAVKTSDAQPAVASEKAKQPEIPAPTKPPEAEDQPERQSVPPHDVQEKIAKQLDEIYKLSEKRSPEDKLAAAKELITLAASPDPKPSERFVLLRRAAEIASDGGDAQLMLEALDAIGEQFELDTLAVKERLLAKLAEAARSAPAMESLVSASSRVVDQAIRQERFDVASGLLTAVLRSCQRPAGRELRKQVLELRKRTESMEKEWSEVAKAQARLKEKPDDATSHLLVGRWLALVKGDWEGGLPHLAKGSDLSLKSLAGKDLQPAPPTADDWVQRGDAWHDLGGSKEGKDRDGCLLRAGYWYQQAEPKLTGLLKTRVQKRLDEIASVPRPETTELASQQPESGPIPRGVWIDLLRNVDPNRDRVTGEWIRQDDAIVASKGSSVFRLMLPVTIEGGYDLEVEFTRDAPKEEVYLCLLVGEATCGVPLGGWRGRISGLERIDGRRADANPTKQPAAFSANRKYVVQARVRVKNDAAAIEVLLDGKPYLAWQGKQASLNIESDYQLPDRRRPGIGTLLASVTFHAARLRLVSGKATLLPKKADRTADGDAAIVLAAEKAQIHGKTLGLSFHVGGNVLVRWNNAADWASWEFAPDPGRAYQIEVNYSCAKNSEGSVYTLGFFTAKGRQLASVQHIVAGTASSWDNYRAVSLGTVKFPQRGPVIAVVKPLKKPGEAVMNLKWVRLTPVATKPSNKLKGLAD